MNFHSLNTSFRAVAGMTTFDWFIIILASTVIAIVLFIYRDKFIL
jgi:hypothetical protein